MKLIKGSGGGKGGGGSSRVAVEAPDSLRSKQLARVVDLVSEGEINGLVDGLRSIYLDNVPLQNADDSFNIDGVAFDSRNGTQGQTHISGFPGVESEVAVGVEVTASTSIVRSITDSDVDSVRVTLSVPRLTSQNTTNGDISGTTVDVAIDVQNNSGGFVTQKPQEITIPLGLDDNDVLSSLTTEIIGAQISIAWTGVGSAFQSIQWRIDYRAVGDATWLVLSNGSLSGSGGVGSKTTSFNAPVDDAYEFRVVKTSGTGTLIPSGSGTSWSNFDSITGKTSSRYQRAYIIPLASPGPWDIRVRRITADSTSQSLQNQTFWDSFTEIQDEKFRYPNSALMAMSVDSELFNKIPTRGYEIEGIILQVPSNYDALTRIYTGVWDGTFITAYSNNPAWVFYDLVLNSRYGLGDYVSAALIDKWGLFEISQYCDELVDDGQGGTEPRFTVNAYIQTREEAIKVLQALASAFAAMSYWAAGAVSLTQDSPKDPIALFTPANVIGGSFSYSGSSARTRSTVIGITWNDPSDLYRKAVEYIEDAVGIERFGFIKKDVVAFGCTSRGQAHRFGKAILFTERMETDTVTFSTGLDGLSISPGEVFQTSDPVRSGDRLGGRLQAATTSTFTLDSAVTIDGLLVYTLWAVMPDGTVEQSTVISSDAESIGDRVDLVSGWPLISTIGADGSKILTVSPAFSGTPELQSIWVLGSTSANPEKWRVISISEDGVNASITGLEYRADKYAAIESDIKLDPIQISNIRIIPDASSDIVVTESLYLITGTLVGVRMSVSWKGQAGARYELEHRPVNGNWIKLNTSTPAIDVEPVVAGINEIRITAISGIGLRGPTSSITKTINGLTAPPVPVDNFQLQAIAGSAFLTWNKSTDLDVIVGGKILIRFTPNQLDPDWSSAIDIGGTISGTSTTASLPLMPGSYLAKWLDSSGNRSTDATIISTNAPTIISLNAVANLVEDPSFQGVKNGTAVSDNRLQLDSAETIGEQTDLMSTWPRIAFLGGITSFGEYAFDGSLDLASVQTSRVTAVIDAFGFEPLDTIDERGLVDGWLSVDGTLIDDVDATLFIRQSDDGATFGSWAPFTTGDYTARAFEFKAELSTESINHNIAILGLSVTIDMADRIESGDDITSGAGVKSIVYATPFIGNPAIGITGQDMATGDFFSVSNKTLLGFDIIFKDSAGTAISRTFDYIVRAY
jgi:predicted phage tail protein